MHRMEKETKKSINMFSNMKEMKILMRKNNPYLFQGII